MHTQPRNGPIEVLVLHSNEGPQGNNAAANLASYLGNIDGGYHAIVDNANTVTVVDDQTEVWGNGGINNRSLDCCMIGYASGTWSDAYSQAEIQRAALWFASKCRQYGIPAVHLTPREVATPGVKGICRHWDVTLAGFPGSAGHTDPGPNFPIDAFVARVAALLAPPPPPPVDPKLTQWAERLQHTPLRFGMQGPDVAILVDELRKRHFLSRFVKGDKYGSVLAAGVEKFKLRNYATLKNRDKNDFGPEAAIVLINS